MLTICLQLSTKALLPYRLTCSATSLPISLKNFAMFLYTRLQAD